MPYQHGLWDCEARWGCWGPAQRGVSMQGMRGAKLGTSPPGWRIGPSLQEDLKPSGKEEQLQGPQVLGATLAH